MAKRKQAHTKWWYRKSQDKDEYRSAMQMCWYVGENEPGSSDWVADVFTAGNRPDSESIVRLMTAAPMLLRACQLASGMIMLRNHAGLPITEGDLVLKKKLDKAIRAATKKPFSDWPFAD